MDRVWAEVFEASASTELATKYIDDLMDQIAAKRDFPNSGSPLYYEGMFTGFYFVVFKSYMAFYKVEGDMIDHSKRGFLVLSAEAPNCRRSVFGIIRSKATGVFA